MRPRVAVAGFGTIGRAVARRVDDDPNFELTAIAPGNADKALSFIKAMRLKVPLAATTDLGELADVVIECAPTHAFEEIARPVLLAGKVLITVSAAALLDHFDLIELAKTTGARIVLATGALLGLDAMRAAALGEIHSVLMITRKPPRSLKAAKHLVENGISLDRLDAPLRVFSGSARDGARAFPANVNVAAGLALAGIGPDRTDLEIWADPALDRNTHRIYVVADSARFELFIENVPTDENPGTGRITALSVIAALQSLYTHFRVGT